MRQQRGLVWEQLKNIGAQRDMAWFLIGDFNEIMNNAEKLGVPPRT